MPNRFATETIFAPATGGGRAAIAVIRITGPAARDAFARLCRRPLPPPRRAARVRLFDAAGAVLDQGLGLFFPQPASYTGEDLVELHVHGGRAVLAAVLAALGGLPGLRPAEPGEFTRRAFENGKLDLTQAEAIADLVDAETAAQRRQALRQMGGALARLYDGWRDRLLRVLAHQEAAIDFPDEEVPEDAAARTAPEITALMAEIREHLDDGHRGERLRDGLHVAIVGAPNVGKSSLLNRLARREAAIVSATAGTTRDVIEVYLDLAGLPVTLADTAGLRAAAAEIESEGVRRARARARDADLKLAVFDATALPDVDAETAAIVDDESVVLVNKWDLVHPASVPPAVAGRPALPVSARTGAGIEDLLERIGAELTKRWAGGEGPVPTRVRHRRALEDCLASLARSRAAEAPELAAEDVRLAVRALGRVTGRVDVEDLLDVIFRDFCIGK